MTRFCRLRRQIGIDPDRFLRDLNGDAVVTRIFQDGKRSHALGISSTPTFFVNGKEATGDMWRPEGVRQMINDALKGPAGP